MTDNLREVQLSSELCEAVERKYAARFGGLGPFLNFVLQEVVRDDTSKMDQAEEQIVEERLKDLGYI